ncbi:MAG: phosphoribosylformylglycinamidine synthase subunit PurL [Candidatus Omnitrophica bacterium]|nr:phosphoribosylformylglycinamidine synthase subunit PurL [Candidatus Omnitrophota bacterium]MCG2703811.1 phosphoribosylformylglycinamidine synthase subunit PurL [Candidatus Omnitrophota bacterium]
MYWRVEVENKSAVVDPVGQGIKRDILDLGIDSVSDVKMAQVYIIEADIAEDDLKRICEGLLCDPVIQQYMFGVLEDKKFRIKPKKNCYVIEIAYNPGVMDPWEDSTKKGIRDLCVEGIISVKTGRKYRIKGTLTQAQLSLISEKLLYNKVIQHVVTIEYLKKTLQAHKEVAYEFKKVEVGLCGLADKGLLNLSKECHLYLNLEEMRTIKKYFSRLGRNPTDCELETIAQTWSEHCVHKTMRGIIDYMDHSFPPKKKPRKIRNLLKTTIMAATGKLNKSWCVSVFKDNAGIIRFDKDHNICFKVETHNHPSALDPYGGAGTGIGGVIRDILGVGLGARPIMNTDVFCFGMPQIPMRKVPQGVLHPKRIMKGVVAGVRDYGNRMGIPTANGAVIFDERYMGNPLVYCGTVGIMPKKYSAKKVGAGEYIVVVGGRTGRDGIHGATFSSSELTHESESISSGAVQIGNAITEKKVLDTLLQARDENLYTAVTDCGAGGLSSAVGEMGQDTGARVDLDKVPLKYNGLSYTEIWISEAQERMVVSVPGKNLKRLLELFAKEDVDAAVIGCFTTTKRLELFFKGEKVCDLDMEFLHEGLPDSIRQARWQPPQRKASMPKNRKNLTTALLEVLSDLNVCSKETIIRQYDHEVQGMSVLKPLGGIDNDGPQDAAVIRPLPYSNRGIIISCGINSRYADIDPYWMAASCVDEALRQIISVGGDLEQVAVLDNFSWGNTSKPDVLGGLVRACFGCRDAALEYGVPFISGKDSLNNEYKIGKKTISIPSTLLISAMAVIKDVRKVVSSDAKSADSLIYCVGLTRDELGASSYYVINGWYSPDVPKINFKKSRAVLQRLSYCLSKRMVLSCHDCSDGGLAVALAEMAFSGGLGMDISLARVRHDIPAKSLRDDVLLFSESNTRFVVEVGQNKKRIFEQALKGIPFACIGMTTAEKAFKVQGIDNSAVIECRIDRLKEAWLAPLRG